MRRTLLTIAVSVLVGAGVAAASAAASTSATSFGLAGAEVRASQTVGTFVGGGAGTAAQSLVWKAVVEHTPLTRTAGGSAVVTGGTVSLRTLVGGEYATVKATLAAGTITYVPERSSTARCGNQVFRVDASIASAENPALGALQVYLTHRRHSFLGRCMIYAATVRGTLSLEP